jgi:hypothetical protein
MTHSGRWPPIHHEVNGENRLSSSPHGAGMWKAPSIAGMASWTMLASTWPMNAYRKAERALLIAWEANPLEANFLTPWKPWDSS